MFQSMAGTPIEDTSSPRFSPFDFNSPRFDTGRIRSDSVQPTHQPEQQLFSPPSFLAVNNTNMGAFDGFGFSDKASLGAYNLNRSLPVTGGELTHINPAAMWSVGHSLSSPENIEHPSQEAWLSGFTPLLTEKATQYRQKHGQITPPDDLSPKSVGPSGSFPDNDSMENERHDRAHSAKRGGTKRRAKTAARGDGGQSPSKRSRKGGKSSKQEESNDSEGEVKREKFLERNRIAASKCRQKKKEWTSNLETRARELTAERAHLTAYVASLKEELLYLKGECLKHTDCNCTRIREYLAHTVAMMSPSSPTLYNNVADSMLTEMKRSKSSDNDLGGSVSTSHSRQASMSADSTHASATTDDDMRAFLSASVGRQAGSATGQQPGMVRR